MNKQKTLIFSLSGVLFLAVSFIVYSWTEPKGTMPSGYTEPINTSTNAQKKFGEIAASMFRDAEKQNYYIDAGGVQSVLAGDLLIDGKIQAGGEILDTDSSSTVVTKGYVDLLLGQTLIEDAPAARLYYIDGGSCPMGTTEVGRKCCSSCDWLGRGVSCSGGPAAVMCAGPDPASMLFALEHSITDCTNAGGTVETVEDRNVKICKFGSQKLTGNCSTNEAYFGNCVETRYSTADSCACPEGWILYKNWSQTEAAYSPCDYIRLTNQGSWESANPHTWSDLRRELCSYGDGPGCTMYMPYVTYKGCY